MCCVIYWFILHFSGVSFMALRKQALCGVPLMAKMSAGDRTWQSLHGKKVIGKASFIVCHMSGTRQWLGRVPSAAAGKKEKMSLPGTAVMAHFTVCPTTDTRQARCVCRVPETRAHDASAIL